MSLLHIVIILCILYIVYIIKIPYYNIMYNDNEIFLMIMIIVVLRNPIYIAYILCGVVITITFSIKYIIIIIKIFFCSIIGDNMGGLMSPLTI